MHGFSLVKLYLENQVPASFKLKAIVYHFHPTSFSYPIQRLILVTYLSEVFLFVTHFCYYCVCHIPVLIICPGRIKPNLVWGDVLGSEAFAMQA